MMKKFFTFVLLGFAAMACSTPQETADYDVIPLPQEVSLTEECPFILEDGTLVVYPESNLKMQKNAEFLVQYAKESSGLELKAVPEAVEGSKAIVLALGLGNENPEAYKLSVSEDTVLIKGASEAGVFYGIQTLRKSLPLMERGDVVLPSVEIFDAPRFAYRGMMLDVCRHFYPIEKVKVYIDMLALHNINRFHWHLSEDQGWRLEIKKYPELTTIGSQRAQTVIGRNSGEYDGIPHGGFYTQEEIRDVVAYAADRYITIVPEIDMPGHMQAALACYPYMGCSGGPYKVREEWGVSSDVLCAGNPKTLQFVKDVLTEVMELFPSEYIHVGGDECAKDEWIKCPKCQARIKELGLKDDPVHTKEQKLQSWFISNVEQFLNENGRRLIGWDEILEGGLAPNATVMAWRDLRRGVDAARLGHDAIMTPSSHVYFDHYQSMDENEPLAIGGYSSVRHVYDYEPIPSDLEPELRKHILGVQANLWTEYIADFDYLQYMVLPRMDALCEVQWRQEGTKDYTAFCGRMGRMLEFYEKLGWNYARHIYDVSADYNLDLDKGGIEVTLNTLSGGEIHYTLDGSEPTAQSLLYSGPFFISDHATLKAVAYHDAAVSNLLEENLSYNGKIKGISLLAEPHPSYRFKGAITLIDGMTGGDNYRTGRWIGFCGRDIEAVIAFKSTEEISSLSFNTCVVTGDWVFDARGVVVEVSEDGEHFTKVAEESYPVMDGPKPAYVQQHKLEFDAVKANYVKVTVISEHAIPEWHSGSHKPGFVFVDELSF